MKSYMTFFCFISIFYVGIYTATAQEAKLNESVKTEYRPLAPSDIAQLQTQNLRESLKLDDVQALSVYEIMYKVELKMEAITKNTQSEEVKMAEIETWELFKTEKLKELLTTEQFTFYMNTIKSDKR